MIDEEPVTDAEDLTGQNRMAWNVLSSWGGHLVFIIAGFILPRMIDRHIGQASLGVWDFSWSLVSYFSLAGLGIGSSVNRHVAGYRSCGDTEELQRTVTSVMAVQLVISVIVMLLTAGVTFSIPYVFAQRLGKEAVDAQWVVFYLGTSLAVQMALDTSRGIMTGCHRWDLHNGINSSGHAVTVVLMMVTLSLGYGIRTLGLIYLSVVVITEIVRTILSHRLCPEAQIHPQYASWSHAKAMMVFGGKTVIAGLPPLLLVQASSLMVASWLGPAALAVYSRPLGLMRNAQTFLNKFAFVLTPTAGSLQESGRTEDLRNLFFQSTRIAVAIALPIVLVLSLQGDLLLRIWMGARYEQGVLLAVLALGQFLPMTQQPVMTILIGMDKHGRIGLIGLATSAVGLVIGLSVAYTTGWSLMKAAVMVSVSFSLGTGLAIFLFACRRLDVSVIEYLKRSYAVPAICNIPLVLCLLASRFLFLNQSVPAFFVGCGIGVLILLPLYFRYVLPLRLRKDFSERVRKIQAKYC